jgi:hypothetical protein
VSGTKDLPIDSLLFYLPFKNFSFIWNARVAQWLKRRRKDLVILVSPVRIPQWDVGAGPSDETEYTPRSVSQQMWHEKEPSLLQAMSA